MFSCFHCTLCPHRRRLVATQFFWKYPHTDMNWSENGGFYPKMRLYKCKITDKWKWNLSQTISPWKCKKCSGGRIIWTGTGDRRWIYREIRRAIVQLYRSQPTTELNSVTTHFSSLVLWRGSACLRPTTAIRSSSCDFEKPCPTRFGRFMAIQAAASRRPSRSS